MGIRWCKCREEVSLPDEVKDFLSTQTFLSDQEYTSLAACTTLTEVKSCLAETIYGPALQGVTVLSVDVLWQKCRAQVANDFRLLQSASDDDTDGTFSRLLSFLTYEPMIDNMCEIIKQLAKAYESVTDFDAAAVLAGCDPIGMDPHFAKLQTFDLSGKWGDVLLRLYHEILMETSVAKYMAPDLDYQFLLGDTHDYFRYPDGCYTRQNLICEHWKKNMLDDFNAFARQLGGEHADSLGVVLDWQADWRALSFKKNSFSLLEEVGVQSLYCNFGSFYLNSTSASSRYSQQSFARIHSSQALSECLRLYYPQYARLSCELGQGWRKQLLFDVQILKRALGGPSPLACIYGWLRLKRHELGNLWSLLDLQSVDSAHAAGPLTPSSTAEPSSSAGRTDSSDKLRWVSIHS